MSLLGTWDDPTLFTNSFTYSDVWGYAANGREYALLGSQGFVHILDVTDPSNITEIERLNTFTNSNTRWRDIKVYQNYAYFTVDIDTNEGLQVIDLSNLPTSASIVYQDMSDFRQAHNTFIDTTSTPVRLYLFGSSGGPGAEDVMVYSLANPASPSLVASLDVPNEDYIHDGYARNDTLYANHGNEGMSAYDLRDLNNPTEIGTLTNYEEPGYNHSVWPTANGKYLIMCDEVPHGLAVKVVEVDKSDPFGLNMEDITTFRSVIGNPVSNSTAHNPYILGDSVVIMSYYGDGVQAWNIEDPENPYRIGYYDTTPNANRGFIGIWGAYPWLPSGNILASDLNTGLYVVKVDNYQIALPVEYASWEARSDGKNAVLSWSTALETDNAGWTIEHAREDGDFRALDFVPAGSGAYQYTHLNPAEGQHFYRLRQRDFDGAESISEIRTLTFGANISANFSAYPNPAAVGRMVNLTGINTDDTWELRSSVGQLITTGRGSQLPAELPAGTYFLRVVDKGVLRIILTH